MEKPHPLMKVPSVDVIHEWRRNIHGCHPWMEKCHPWMKVSSVDECVILQCHPWMASMDGDDGWQTWTEHKFIAALIFKNAFSMYQENRSRGVVFYHFKGFRIHTFQKSFKSLITLRSIYTYIILPYETIKAKSGSKFPRGKWKFQLCYALQIVYEGQLYSS